MLKFLPSIFVIMSLAMPAHAEQRRVFGGVNAQVQSMFSRAVEVMPSTPVEQASRAVELLAPTFIGGLLTVSAFESIGQANTAVQVAQRYRNSFDHKASGICYDVVLDAREYATTEQAVKMMEWVDSAWHPDAWTFSHASVEEGADSRVMQAAASFARSHAQRIGGFVSGRGDPPAVDYALIAVRDGRINQSRIDALASQGLTVVATIESSAKATGLMREVAMVAGRQSSGGFRLSYPLLEDGALEKQIMDETAVRR